jgi:uncharacterized protein (UPF0248 family)
MKPIIDLINKIKWDESESPEEYTLGYEDRVSKRIVEVKYTEIKRMEGNFMIIERDSEEASIPVHRIRIVKKNNKIVWERPKSPSKP